MAKRSLQQVLSQIESLQKEAEELRSSEKADVIARIQEAISHYSITSEELFPTRQHRGRKTPTEASSKKPKRAKSQVKRGAGVPKYRDPGSEKTWTGQGKRPGWYVEALAAGKTADDLLIR